MNKRTPLYEQHLAAGGKLVDFSGWDMPINYGSQIAEHKQVREHAGVFDVSHMSVVDVRGPGALPFLRYLVTNDPIKLEPGKALYTAMLNEKGGVVDDILIYQLDGYYRIVANCGTREKDLAWFNKQSVGFEVALTPRPEMAILAVNGPQAIDLVCSLLDDETVTAVRALKNFRAVEIGEFLYARTGYTGELGLELIFPAQYAVELWNKLLEIGVKPIGLGARDTLRLEAGMNLYGHDMTDDTSPLESNMEQVVSWEPVDRDFIGRAAITEHKQLQQDGKLPHLTGLVFEGRGVLREGQRIETDAGPGVITSGTFSPTLNHSIALARIPVAATTAQVDMRGTLAPVRIVKPSFVRFGKKVFE